MYEKVFGNIKITMDVSNKDIENNYISISNATTGVQYLHKNGKFTLTRIDNGCLAISKDDDNPSVTLLINQENNIAMRTFKKEVNNDLYIDDDLRNQGIVIMPYNDKKFLFNYKTNTVISYPFDNITPSGNLFKIKYLTYFGNRLITFSGYLDATGHLIDQELYASILNRSFKVNEQKIGESLSSLAPIIEKLLYKQAKKDYQTRILDFEYEAYKRRKSINNQKKNSIF